MSKQYTVNLSPRERWDVLGFIIATVQPKDRDAARKLKGVMETFGLVELKDRLESIEEGEKLTRKDFSAEREKIETGSVDLNTLLDYLDKPGATALGSLTLLDISDELLRAKEGRRLEAVAEG